MKSSSRRLAAFVICTAAAALSGCSAYQSPTATPPMTVEGVSKQTGSQTFKYTGTEQDFRIPSGVTQVTVLARGGGTPSGDYGSSGPFFTGSNGGLVQATIPVKPGERLAVFVGGKGQLGLRGFGGVGGFNGGGTGGAGIYYGYFNDGGCGGAGASDVRVGGDRLKNRVIVAGGGGGPGIGGGFYGGGAGGQGGGKVGGPGGSGYPGNPSGFGGLGGTQSAGGKPGPGGDRSGFPPGVPGNPGKLGRGGLGGGNANLGAGGGGGGGGGYYGGGGGGSGTPSTSGVGGGGGGGGGSSYIEPSATHVKNVQAGGTAGNGKIVISW
jgi:hypothetical protein